MSMDITEYLRDRSVAVRLKKSFLSLHSNRANILEGYLGTKQIAFFD